MPNVSKYLKEFHPEDQPFIRQYAENIHLPTRSKLSFDMKEDGRALLFEEKDFQGVKLYEIEENIFPKDYESLLSSLERLGINFAEKSIVFLKDRNVYFNFENSFEKMEYLRFKFVDKCIVALVRQSLRHSITELLYHLITDPENILKHFLASKAKNDLAVHEEKVKDLYKNYVAAIAKLADVKKMLAIIEAGSSVVLDNILNKLNMPRVETCEIKYLNLSIVTTDLYSEPFLYRGSICPSKYIGKFKIDYNLYSSKINISNIESPNEVGFLYRYLNSTDVCLGSFANKILNAVSSYDIPLAVEYIIEYLIDVDMLDTACERNWKFFPNKKPKKTVVSPPTSIVDGNPDD
jgi:hypothetical protein